MVGRRHRPVLAGRAHRNARRNEIQRVDDLCRRRLRCQEGARRPRRLQATACNECYVAACSHTPPHCQCQLLASARLVDVRIGVGLLRSTCHANRDERAQASESRTFCPTRLGRRVATTSIDEAITPLVSDGTDLPLVRFSAHHRLHPPLFRSLAASHDGPTTARSALSVSSSGLMLMFNWRRPVTPLTACLCVLAVAHEPRAKRDESLLHVPHAHERAHGEPARRSERVAAHVLWGGIRLGTGNASRIWAMELRDDLRRRASCYTHAPERRNAVDRDVVRRPSRIESRAGTRGTPGRGLRRRAIRRRQRRPCAPPIRRSVEPPSRTTCTASCRSARRSPDGKAIGDGHGTRRHRARRSSDSCTGRTPTRDANDRPTSFDFASPSALRAVNAGVSYESSERRRLGVFAAYRLRAMDLAEPQSIRTSRTHSRSASSRDSDGGSHETEGHRRRRARRRDAPHVATPMLGPPPSTDHASVFDDVWREFDLHYSFFQLKDIDWTAIGARYRPQALAAKSDVDFAVVISQHAGRAARSSRVAHAVRRRQHDALRVALRHRGDVLQPARPREQYVTASAMTKRRAHSVRSRRARTSATR